MQCKIFQALQIATEKGGRFSKFHNLILSNVKDINENVFLGIFFRIFISKLLCASEDGQNSIV